MPKAHNALDSEPASVYNMSYGQYAKRSSRMEEHRWRKLRFLPPQTCTPWSSHFSNILDVSVIRPATCALAAKLKAWILFPEYKRISTGARVHNVEYVEIDWQTGRSIVVKRQKRPALPPLLAEEPDADFHNDWRIEEGAE